MAKMTRARGRYLRKLANKVVTARRQRILGPRRRTRLGRTHFVPRCRCGKLITVKAFTKGPCACVTCAGQVRG